MGHDKRICRSYELMMDQSPAYCMQIEMHALDPIAGMACVDFKGKVKDEGEWG